MPNVKNIVKLVKKPIAHLQGNEAVQMFKQYGGIKPNPNSINYEQLLKYVPEARERYGLVGNTEVSDEEIAQALYKHVKELAGDTKALNSQGEPQLLFRGDTKPYTELRTNHHEAGGSEDNLLGTLFLDRTGIGEGWGPDRYLFMARENGTVMAPYHTGIETESFDLISPKFKEGYLAKLDGKGYVDSEDVLYPYWKVSRKGDIISGSKIANDAFTEGNVNHLNGFIVKTPKERDITYQIVTSGGGRPPKQGEELQWFIPKEERIGASLHDVQAKQAKAVVKDAKQKGEGLLRSKANGPYRGEHENYDYFAVPDFNAKNVKHILPYDLRIPRDWTDPNIYRVYIPGALIGGVAGTFQNK